MIQSRKYVPQYSQFLNLPNPNINYGKISALKLLELCIPSEVLYSYIQGFLSVIQSN